LDYIKADDPVTIARMEKLGEAQVRLLMSSGNWPPQLNPIAVDWLAKKDQEAGRLRGASQAEQMDIARAAKVAAERASAAAERAATAAERQALAAERANTRATIAIIIAAISIIATAISILVTHWDAIT
jgi:hypothetical protein